MSTKAKRICKDCYPKGPDPWTKTVNYRPAPHPGPRCATHHRDRKKELSRASHARRVKSVYGITGEQYWALYEAQGGVCYICQRAKGTGKRKLAVDHDHVTGYVRGLLCSLCNNVLAHFRDDLVLVGRLNTYLTWPPAFDVIGKVKPDGDD